MLVLLLCILPIFVATFLHSAVELANLDRALKDLAIPNIVDHLCCIQYPDLDADFELKLGLIHRLPRFHGLASKDPYKHLKEYA